MALEGKSVIGVVLVDNMSNDMSSHYGRYRYNNA